jgi:hypothetical protein
MNSLMNRPKLRSPDDRKKRKTVSKVLPLLPTLNLGEVKSVKDEETLFRQSKAM